MIPFTKGHRMFVLNLLSLVVPMINIPKECYGSMKILLKKPSFYPLFIPLFHPSRAIAQISCPIINLGEGL
jgi:hypothetical protein